MSIEFKYDINDVVWFIRNAKVYRGIVTQCSYFKSTTLGEEYEVKSYDIKSEYSNRERLYEDELFPTKDDLLDKFKKENGYG